MGLITFDTPKAMDEDEKRRKRIRALAQGRLFHESGDYMGGAPPLATAEPPARQFHESGDYMGGAPPAEPAPELDEEEDQGDELDEGEEEAPKPPFSFHADVLTPGQKGAELDRLRDRLEAVRGIAEGLGKIGETVTPGDILLRTPRPRPFVAEGIRKEQKRIDEQVRPEEAAALKQVGITVPEGTRSSFLKQLLPSVARVQAAEARGRERTAAASAAAEAKGETLGFRKENLKNTIADRFTKYAPAVELEKNRNAAESAIEQLESGDPNRQKLALNTLVRLSGDTRLSDEDRRQIQLPLGGPERWKAILERGLLGRFDEGMIESLKKVASGYLDRVPKIKERYAREFAHRNANQFLKAEDIYSQLSGSYEGPGSAGGKKIRIPKQDAQAIADAKADGYEVETY